MLLRFQGVAADRGQIRHRLGTARIGAQEILRCAKDLGLKARARRTNWSRLARTPLPAIASLRDDAFLVIANAADDKVLVQFDGDVLAVRPDGPITREDVGTLPRTADEYLADHPKIAGLMVETRTFPGFASIGAFADYARLLPITTPACHVSH
jgi:ATP-binding cassette, subfamily B, bacterial HlyB/CyaB